MSEHASAWKPLIDDWVTRERSIHPDAPIRPDSVRVRDSIEIDDHAFVLVSYDVAYPWPQEEDTATEGRTANTAVLQAARVRQPWIERDVTRALAHMSTADGSVAVSDHLLGDRRAYSGHVSDASERVVLKFEDGSSQAATVVDGWFLSVADAARRAVAIEVCEAGSDPYVAELHRDDVSDVMPGMDFTRSAGRTMYFSPLDLRSVVPLVRWQREGDIVVVASSIERYDDGGVLRLRVDGVRTDDDVFVSWPLVSIEVDGQPVTSALCAEFAQADTLTIDVGFRPWMRVEGSTMSVSVHGLRGAEGAIDPITIDLAVRDITS